MKVSVIGTGYVGLVTAVCLAEHGHDVTCVDVDAAKVDAINAGVAPFHESGLDELLARHIHNRITATIDLETAVRAAELSIIAVGTPFNGHQVDLTQITAAARRVGDALKNTTTYHVVVVKSTVVPGTTSDVVRPILEAASGKQAGRDFGVAMNPEFLREGEAIHDFMHPDRIVVGGIDARSIEAVADLYRCFDGVPLVRTNTRTAEMIKYGTNALWATLISFSNEIGNLCSTLGDIDVVEVMHGVHLDKRLSPMVHGERVTPGLLSYLAAGCGFGGSCLPKDVQALIAQGRALGQPMRVLGAVMDVNREQPMQVVAALEEHFPTLAGIRVSVLGLAFKAGTDDLRESAAMAVIHALAGRSASLTVYDPVAIPKARSMFGNGAVKCCDSLADCISDAEAIVVLTPWPEFAHLPALIEAAPNPPIVIDGRRFIDKRAVRRYAGIGVRMPAAPPPPALSLQSASSR
jgi:UDPglucose 6-dehydrogenase/GDP-mannose 6-dehydrogenase